MWAPSHLLSGEIADDIAAYFVESEQIPTACALGVLVGTDQSVTSAGGYLIQLLPGAGEDIITKIEAGVQRVGSVSHALEGGLDGAGLLRAVLSDFDLEILETHPVEYRCYCSRDRVTRALISMGREELSSLIQEQGQAGAHLPVLRPDLPLLQGGSGGDFGQYVTVSEVPMKFL